MENITRLTDYELCYAIAKQRFDTLVVEDGIIKVGFKRPGNNVISITGAYNPCRDERLALQLAKEYELVINYSGKEDPISDYGCKSVEHNIESRNDNMLRAICEVYLQIKLSEEHHEST